MLNIGVEADYWDKGNGDDDNDENDDDGFDVDDDDDVDDVMKQTHTLFQRFTYYQIHFNINFTATTTSNCQWKRWPYGGLNIEMS